MKTLYRHIFRGIFLVIVMIFFGIIFLTVIDWKRNGDFFIKGQIEKTGRVFAYVLTEENAFPRDVCPVNTNLQVSQYKQWFEEIKIERLLKSCINTGSYDVHKINYDDIRLWTIVKNLPDNSPKNLIVLATRNVDPASLRTKLGMKDMQKHIRFKKERDDVKILRRFAVLINAGGGSITVPVTFSPDRSANLRYDVIYRHQSFDLTTNLVNGLQVKYLTPNGEIIPTND